MLVLPILLASGCVLVVLLYFQYKWRYRRVLEAASKLPSPPSIPIIGSLLILHSDLTTINTKITKIAKGFKGLFSVWVGPMPIVIVSNPADVKIILNSSNMLEKHDFYKFFWPYLRDGILTAPVPIWKKNRRLLNPVFHPSNIENYLPLFNDVGTKITAALGSAGEGLIDTRNIIFSNVMDAASETLFGGAPLSTDFKSSLMFLLDWVGKTFVIRASNIVYYFEGMFKAFYWRDLKRASNHMTSITSAINKLIRYVQHEKIEGSTKRLSVLDVICSSGNLEDQHWVYELITISSAASDTLVCSIYFLLISLASNQDVQEKVYSEINEVIGCSEGEGVGEGEGELTARDLNSLTYLGHAITESMRLHGVIPLIGRLATKDTKLTDVTLPAGSRVLISLHAMGMDPDVFSEPNRFNPDRFMTEGLPESCSITRQLLLFSGGPRNCIGKVYAILLIKTIIVRILSKYKLTTSIKLEDIEYEFKVVMFSKNPLLVQFHPR